MGQDEGYYEDEGYYDDGYYDQGYQQEYQSPYPPRGGGRGGMSGRGRAPPPPASPSPGAPSSLGVVPASGPLGRERPPPGYVEYPPQQYSSGYQSYSYEYGQPASSSYGQAAPAPQATTDPATSVSAALSSISSHLSSLPSLATGYSTDYYSYQTEAPADPYASPSPSRGRGASAAHKGAHRYTPY
eukprot:TRINITY_DN3026_c0_g1_i4.p1 TRINITY_DN3026_c0_g1~~TRINITY_DN3026_c0_g1_i4.p1  ORF type:complete len:196 (-),score=59.11 TRINITY_DN3026_c0_g1_i4:140-697(-)